MLATVRVTASDDTTENLNYVIHSDNLCVVGMRICTTGEKSIFSDCGEVDELGVTDTYNGTIHHHWGWLTASAHIPATAARP